MSEVVIVKRRRAGCGLLLLFLFLGVVILLITVSSMGVVKPFFMPTGEMAPAVSKGDHVMMETFTYRSHPPQRGDVVVFKMDKSGQMLAPGTYIMRIVGLPGETLRLTEETLFINDKPVVMHNVMGKIHYALLKEAVFLSPGQDSVTVPKDSYFMLGDNTNASPDSRFWGFLPTGNVLGKLSFVFWPSTRMGMVK